MDDLLLNFASLDHYQLLGVAPDADAATLAQAFQARLRRYDPVFAAPQDRASFERLSRAMEGAFAVLRDPTQRLLYDRAQRASSRAAGESLSDLTWVAVPEHAAPSARPSHPQVTSPPAEDPRVATLQAEVGTLLVEVERLAVALHLTLAQVLSPDNARIDALFAASQALLATRAALANAQARREEAAERWDKATEFWNRAAKVKPDDPTPLMRASDALRRGKGDLDGAEAFARRALEVDPDLAEAHAALALIAARRARRISGAR